MIRLGVLFAVACLALWREAVAVVACAFALVCNARLALTGSEAAGLVLAAFAVAALAIIPRKKSENKTAK